MKQRVEYITEGEEEVVFRVYQQEGISDLELIKQKKKIIGNLEGEKILFQPQQILYLEYVDEIRSFQSMVGNRMIATMSNGEKLVISRHYSKQIRYYLKEVNGSGKAEKDNEA